MLKQLKKNSYINLFWILILGLLLWIGDFINSNEPLFNEYETNFYLFLKDNINFNGTVISFIITISEAFYLAFITNKNKTFGKNTYIIGFVFVVLMSPPFLHNFSPIIIANIFIIIAIKILLDLIDKKESPSQFFEVAMLMAIATIIYPQYLFIFILTIIFAIIIRSKITKEILAIIIGFFAIYLLYYELYFLIEGHLLRFNFFDKILFVKNIKFIKTLTFISYAIGIGLIMIISLLHLTNTIGFKEIDKRTVFQLILSGLIFIIFMFLIIPSIGTNAWSTLAIPLSFLISNYFSNTKLNITNKLLFVFFILLGFVFYLDLF